MSHKNGMIEPMYAENTITTKPRPILKKSFSAIRSDSLNNSLDSLEQFKSKSNGTSRDGNLNNSSYDSKVSMRNAFFRNELERKFSNLSSEDFSSTQTDNLEYLKYNALSYQQNNVINDYEKEIYRQISDTSSSPRYYEDVSRSNSCEDKVEVSRQNFLLLYGGSSGGKLNLTFAWRKLVFYSNVVVFTSMFSELCSIDNRCRVQILRFAAKFFYFLQ